MALTPYSHALALARLAEDGGTPLTLSPDGARIGFSGSPSAELRELVRGFLGAQEGREGSPHYRAMVRMLRAPTVAVRELLAVPVHQLGALPAGYVARGTIKYEGKLPTIGGRVVSTNLARMDWAWSTYRAGFDALLKAGVCAFTAKELERAAYALEHGRAGPGDMVRWCGAKAGRDWVLSPELARAADLRGYAEGKTFSSLTVGELLDGLGAEIVSVEWKDG